MIIQTSAPYMQYTVFMLLPLFVNKRCQRSHNSPVCECSWISWIVYHPNLESVCGTWSQIVKCVLGDHAISLKNYAILPIKVSNEVIVEVCMIGPSWIKRKLSASKRSVISDTLLNLCIVMEPRIVGWSPGNLNWFVCYIKLCVVGPQWVIKKFLRTII